jgi:hypothetical protein
MVPKANTPLNIPEQDWHQLRSYSEEMMLPIADEKLAVRAPLT